MNWRFDKYDLTRKYSQQENDPIHALNLLPTYHNFEFGSIFQQHE